MVLNFLALLEICSKKVPITSEASESFIFLSPAEAEVWEGHRAAQKLSLP